jgi:hypothetical protein
MLKYNITVEVVRLVKTYPAFMKLENCHLSGVTADGG